MEKTNPKLRGLGAIFFALLLVMSITMAPFFQALPQAFAGDTPTKTITINVGNSNNDQHSLYAYQVFSGTVSGSEGSYKLADIDWGDGVDPVELLKNLKADSTIGSLFTDISDTAASDKATAQTIANTIKDFNAEKSAAFAQVVKNSVTGTGTQLSYTPATDTEEACWKATVPVGYWAVIDTATNQTKDSLQDVVLQVVGDVTIDAKITTVQSGKDTLDGVTNPTSISVSDTGWTDTSDYNIGDDVAFRIWGTVPDDVAGYTNGYDWTLTDTLDEGFTLTDPLSNLEVYTADLNTDGTPNFSATTPLTDYATYLDIAVDTTKNEITVSAKANTDTSKGSMAFVNNATKFKNKAIIVTYTAQLDSDAVPGTAETNKVNLTHTTDKSAHGTTGNTPDDTTYTFTYELDNTKVDNKGAAITTKDAEFKLVRQKPTDSNVYQVATVDSNNKISGWVDLASFETDGDNADDNGDTTITDGSKLTADASGNFNIIGLDEGTYYLVETAAPTGYNKLTKPVSFKIEATTDLNEQKVGEIKSLTLTESDTNVATDKTASDATTSGKVAQNIINTPAGSLPSTGGMGTVLYIAVGLIIMAAAVALILVRRRNRANGQE